jgi:hypothetical protein
VEPIGVGELFIVAGQSYATNSGDERLNVKDMRGRIVAFNVASETWAVANDPQPVPDGSDGGSIWPPLGDALADELRVPIGFANVAVGATSSTRWMPGGQLYPRLVKVGQTLGQFRAVLWQQGESDVIEKTATDKYVANLQKIRDTATKTWGVDPPWLLAKSTHHPTVYSDSDGEDRIRSAIDELVKRPGFRPGPDTDTLRGENRGGVNTRRHFSAIGQQHAAELWLAAIRREVIPVSDARNSLRVGVAEVDITPPLGFPMAGYYHERLAEGTIDPLKAKAIIVSDRRDRSRARRVRFDRHRDRPEAGYPPASVGEDEYSGVTHCDLGDALAYGARLHEGTVSEAGWRTTGSVAGGLYREADQRPSGGNCAGGRHRQASHAGSRLGDSTNPGVIQSPLRDARRQRADLAELQ